MKYAVKKLDGSFKTTLYGEATQNVIDFHADRNEELVPVNGLDIEYAEDGLATSVTPIPLSEDESLKEAQEEARKVIQERLIERELETDTELQTIVQNAKNKDNPSKFVRDEDNKRRNK